MKFPYEELYYLKARGPDDKRPAESWGGYNQDFDDAECVYTHADVEMLPGENWLVNGYRDGDHMAHQLLVFDLDVHKAPDGFDVDRVGVPSDTPVVKSQSGGFHVYFVVNRAARGKESDFEIVADLPFDIDIRGEFVKHHVVAPNAIPGVGGGYELVNDTTIKHVFDPAEAAEQITFDGDPALAYNPGVGRGSGGGYERESVDPPENLPKCYAAGLSLRAEAPDDENLNTHKVNVLTALAGLAAGYDVETVTDHFIEEYYPGEPRHADREKTEYQVGHIARKLDRGEYDPPAVRTMQEYGILPRGETCTCGLPGHHNNDDKSPYYGLDLQAIARENGIAGDPYRDETALLRACLYAREESPDVAGEKPPYAALVAVAEHVGLGMKDPDEGILGKVSYNVASRVFDDLAPGDV